jgi:putative chitinase
MINAAKLSTKIPQVIMDELPLVMQKFSITNPLRMAHFLAQCAHESGNFKVMQENLNYSTDRLLTIFSKYFKKADGTPDRALAETYARKPEKIANRVYANRMGNGDEASGEGYKFRGRGAVQTTGKDNYKAFSDFIGEDCVANPDLLLSKYSLSSAAFFFHKNKLWDICDKGSGKDIVTSVTKRVNGGTHGLDDRLQKFELFNSLLA